MNTGLLSEGATPLATQRLIQAESGASKQELLQSIRLLHIYVLCLEGRKDEAEALIHQSETLLKGVPGMSDFLTWLDQTFSVNGEITKKPLHAFPGDRGGQKALP